MRNAVATWVMCVTVTVAVAGGTRAVSGATAPAKAVTIAVGEAKPLGPRGGSASQQWESSDPAVLSAYRNGYVIGLKPGSARVRSAGGDEFAVTVKLVEQPVVDAAKLRQYDDNRRFEIGDRKCYGSELNGQRAASPEEEENTLANRVINPKLLRDDRPTDWLVADGTEVYDGAGVLMGTVAADLKVGEKKVPTSKFNFGMSKILNGRVCLYAFSIDIEPTAELAKTLSPAALKDGTVGTSAWLPLDRVVEKEALLERVGVGKVKLPRLPLSPKKFRITGGDPKQYMTEFDELRIVKDPKADPVPSHYLRRPSGTVNIIYSVPGFGLGGQGLDSLLVGHGIVFRPAVGAKIFTQPTYYPAKHPKAGQKSPKTMTFVYGAAEVKGVEPVYGWVAREALAPVP